MIKKKIIKEFAGKKILIIVENLPSPFDRRVWQEATSLHKKGAEVSIICPTGRGFEKRFEVIDGIHIYRHALPCEADSALGYLLEYSSALFWEFYLTLKVFFTRGFDVIHACNPPDLIFLVAAPFKLFGKKFLFDHHDINPELYIAKFNRKDVFYQLMILLERLTLKLANVSIATNESYKEIAVVRGKKRPEDVFVVRSGPSLERLKIKDPIESLKMGKKNLIGYVGVIGKQEGLNYLLEACAHLVYTKNFTDVHFICVGGGTELENIKIYAKELEVSEYFTFTGRVPDEELVDALNTADICVNPDEFNVMNDKSTMNKIMEYMALKKPIVQFDLAEGRFSAQGASLYAKPNDSVDLAEKILELINDPKKRNEMGDFGYKRVKSELEWNYEVENLYAAYRKIFGMKSPKQEEFHGKLTLENSNRLSKHLQEEKQCPVS